MATEVDAISFCVQLKSIRLRRTEVPFPVSTGMTNARHHTALTSLAMILLSTEQRARQTAAISASPLKVSYALAKRTSIAKRRPVSVFRMHALGRPRRGRWRLCLLLEICLRIPSLLRGVHLQLCQIRRM